MWQFNLNIQEYCSIRESLVVDDFIFKEQNLRCRRGGFGLQTYYTWRLEKCLQK